jgi:hypothetical protein
MGFQKFLFGFVAVLAFMGAGESTWAKNRCGDVMRTVGMPTQTAVRPLNEIKDLVVMTYNVENLFYRVGQFERMAGKKFRQKPGGQGQRPKPEYEVRGVSEAIKDVNPDVIILEEVENVFALDHLNEQYLDHAYQSVLVQGNDARGINVGFLIKKNLPFHMEVESHKDMTWYDPVDKENSPL